MNTRIPLLRGFLLAASTGSGFYLAYGNEDRPVVHIARNLTWNDFLAQIKFLPDDSPQDSLEKCLSARRFPRPARPRSQSESTMSKCSRPWTGRALGYKRPTEIWSPCEMNCPRASDSLEMTLLKPDTVICCSKCLEEIRRGVGFVCFKISGKEGYRFFHCRFRGGDCWEAYRKESQSA